MSLTRQFSANYGSIATLAFTTTLRGTILHDDPRNPSIATLSCATLVLLHVAKESATVLRI
jgi:hypothetical protein